MKRIKEQKKNINNNIINNQKPKEKNLILIESNDESLDYSNNNINKIIIINHCKKVKLLISHYLLLKTGIKI